MAHDLRGRGPVVLASKLRPPSVPADAVRRPHLVTRLDDAPPSALRVLIAPAGWGKSVLLAQWIDARPEPVAYVAIDGGDNDVARCWTHILAAVANATGVLVDDLSDALRAPGVDIVAEVVEPLMSRLEQIVCTIALDDFHLATGVEVQESLMAVADTRPPNVGLLVASRIEPPLHLPRRRVRQELIEIRLDELRLSVAESGMVLEAAAGKPIDGSVIDALHAITEGWPAGLYLAGVSLRSANDPEQVAERFAADDRHLSEYLAAEVLGALPTADREFLIGTSVLDELDADICDAVLGRVDSGVHLESLARSNLFMLPSGTAPTRYRYHHLFRQWLELELRATGPDGATSAHRRAAAEYERRGELDKAVPQALAAGDSELAHRLISAVGFVMLDEGRHATLAGWFAALPDPPSPKRQFDISLLRAWSGMVEGDHDAVDRFCRAAEVALESGEVTGFRAARRGEIPLLRAYCNLLRGATGDAREALATATEAGTVTRANATAAWIDAAIGYWDADVGRQAFESAHEVAIAAGDPFAQLLDEAFAALCCIDDRELGAALRWADQAVATAERQGITSFGYLATAHLANAQLAIEAGDIGTARAESERAIELAQRRGDLPTACLARIVLAQIHHMANDRTAAAELLELVAKDLEPIGGPRLAVERLGLAQRQLRLQQQPVSPRDFVAPVERLTDREIALLQLLPGELTQREIGAALHMSFNTVKSYNRQIYRKLGVASRDEAVEAARAAGLL